MLVAKPARRDLEALTAFIEAGHVTPVIEKTYPLAETVEALRHHTEQHARSKIVISVTTPLSPGAGQLDETRKPTMPINDPTSNEDETLCARLDAARVVT